MKAIALLSGLDSVLAVKLIQGQGIKVVGLTFTSPFFGLREARRAADLLGIPLRVVDIAVDFLPVLLHPKYGYGRYLNPCIDCHILMVRKAGEFLVPLGASFIITGEVLGERPMSQNPEALRIVVQDSGVGDLLLRPLSAKLLLPTLPEREGWVDREKLLAIQGRSRKPQMALAEKYGLKEYPTPAGGCLLTDPGFSRRLKEYLAASSGPTREDIELLKWGRHFWTPQGAWIIVARREKENKLITANARPGDYLLCLKDLPGPWTAVKGPEVTLDVLKYGAALTARYSKAREEGEVSVLASQVGGNRIQELRLAQPKIKELVGQVHRVGENTYGKEDNY